MHANIDCYQNAQAVPRRSLPVLERNERITAGACSSSFPSPPHLSEYTQAHDPTTPEALRTVLLKLAHRLISSSATPSYYNADRFHLHLTILRQLGLYDEAYEMVESESGQIVCSSNLSCEELRREIWKLKGLTKEAGEAAEKRILEAK